MADLDFLEQNGDTAEANIKAGVAALTGDRTGMLTSAAYWTKLVHKTIFLEHH